MSDLLQERDDRGVLTITLNRESVHNAFNDDLIQKITELFEKVTKDKATRLIVLTGTGRSFCAGADLNWMKSMKSYTQEENFQDSKKLAKMFETINSCHKPVIGKINGHALGGGVGLLSVCDYNHTHKLAKFGFTEVCLGLIPAVISPYVLKRIGEGMGRAYFLSGEKFMGDQALQMNLVNKVSELKTFEADFEQTVESFLKAAPQAAVKAKKLIFDVFNSEEKDLQDMTCQAISEKRIDDEGQEGMSALLEKRKPNWIK